MRNVYKITRRPEGKGPLEICRLRREDNIKTDLIELVCEVVDWIHQTLKGFHGGRDLSRGLLGCDAV